MKITPLRILAVSLVVVVTITVGIAWFLWNLNLNDYRRQISTIVNIQTGWQLELAGTIEHHAIPHGFWLLAHNIRIIDPRGQFVDIERFQAQVSLERIFSGQVTVSSMEVAVRSCDVKLRPEITPPIPISLDVEASTMHLTARDCHVLDVDSGLDTHIENLIVDVAPMPLMIKGWVVAGMPAGVLSTVQRGTVQATTVAFGDLLGLKQLDLVFSNNHGLISLPSITTTLQPPKSNKFGPISPLLTAKGRIKLGFNETPQALFSTLWNGVDDVWLEPFSLALDELQLELATGPVYCNVLQIEATAMPILANGEPLLKWLSNSPITSDRASYLTTIKGTGLSYADWNLADYTLTMDLQPGRSRLTLENGTLSTTLPENSLAQSIVLDLNSSIDLVTDSFPPSPVKGRGLGGGVAASPLQRVILERLVIAIKQLEIATKDSEYRLDSGRLTVLGLPLVQGGVIITPELPNALLNSIPTSTSATLQMKNFNHNGGVIESIIVELAAHDDVLHLQQLEANIGDTKLTGGGKLNLIDPKLPWYLKINSPGINIEPVLTIMDAPSLIQGVMKVDLDLKSQGIQLNNLLSNLSGTLKMTGNNLQVVSIDVDSVITRLEDSRGVGLLDVGAYILLGPAGILLTKGTQYSVLLGSVIAKGNSQITAMSSALQVESGVVRTEDVALVTKKHRLAMVGTMDLREEGPASLQIATVDAKGCAKYMETIGGTGRNPEVSKTGMVINSVLNPVKSVVGTIIGPVIGSCFVPFYQGQIPAPSEK